MIKKHFTFHKKASKVNKKKNPLQAVTEKKKYKMNLYFNEYELKCKKCWKWINVSKDEDNRKILKSI